jgi:hypothetical protein
MGFGYTTLPSGGTINSPSQVRRSTDMIYQRGNSFEVILTGDTYQSSMELVVDLYSDDSQVGSMTLVPFSTTQSGSTYTYKFNIRPYEYYQNFVETEHYRYYYLNDWVSTTEAINWNNPYTNSIKANIKYMYRFLSGSTIVNEFSGGTANNDFNHYTATPSTSISYASLSGFTNTGKYFDYIGGQFQLDEKYIMPNFDQTVGTVYGLNGNTLQTLNTEFDSSPINQFYMDGPSLPEPSDTGRFLTDAPRVQYVQSDDNYVLYYLNGQTGDRQVMEADFAVFEFYDTNNELITSFNQELNFSGTTWASPTGFTDTLQIFSLPCGPADITNIFANIDYSIVAYYRVQLYYAWWTYTALRESAGPLGPSSESFYFYLYDNCKPENTRLAWLNARGGFDYYTFTAFRQDSKKISRQTYDNRYYQTNLQSPDRDMARTVKTFATDVEQEIVLESDFISVPVGNWLEQLFISPQVYIMKPDYISPIDRQDKIYKDLTPVQILSTDVQTITKKHQKLNKYRITMKVANTFFVNKGF